MDEERHHAKQGWADWDEPNPARIPMEEVGTKEYTTPLFDDEEE
jgi:hypothetical protein